MKKLLATLASALLMLAGFSAQAQTSYHPSEVTISKEKVEVDGRQYYSHIVREKQTLYSIGRKYGVSSLDIIDANPSLNLDRRAIKAGDVLLIPVTEKALAEELLAPVEEETPVIVDTVKAAMDTIRAAADTLPAHEETLVVPADTLVIPADSLLTPADTVPEFVCIIPDVINVTLMLPMGADSTANPRYMDFYFGALLAARDLGNSGIRMKIHTIDTQNAHAFKDAGKAFSESDVIIGPVSASDISKALPLLPEGKFLVSPMDARTEELTTDSPVILAATPAGTQIKDAVQWMLSDSSEHDIILVSETDVKLSRNMTVLKEDVDASGREDIVEVDYAVSNGLEMNEWFGQNTHLKDTLSKVMAVSERDVFVKDVIRNVYLQNSLKHNVEIFGPARTKSSDVEEMCNARLHQSATYYVDYDRREVIDFVNNYRALFHAEPDNYAFHGYDTMRYFVTMCSIYGINWEQKLGELQMSGLQTFFKFEEKDEESVGHVNSGLRRVTYLPGFNIKSVDR